MEKQTSFEDTAALNHSPVSSTAINRTITTSQQSSFTTQQQQENAEIKSVHKKDRHITVKEGFMAIVKASYVNVLLVFVPIGIASHFVWSPTVTFIMNFLAIIPLAKLLGFATEDIALRTGEVKREMPLLHHVYLLFFFK